MSSSSDNHDANTINGQPAPVLQESPAAQSNIVNAPNSSVDNVHHSLFPVAAIGASAGGLGALKAFFTHVPKDSGIAFVVVMHLSPEHESHLEEILQPGIKIPVQQVTKTVLLEKNRVYIIPPNANLDAIDTHLRLSTLETRRNERAPIDHFFRTLAENHGSDAIGIILTGTGSDGTLGLQRIKERGGLTVVQDPADAEYDGMPKSAISSVQVDMVLPVSKMPQAILQYINTEPRLPVPTEEEDAQKETKHFLKKIFAVIQARTGRDFSQYKRSTLLRRISRRMQLHHIQEPPSYVEFLRRNPDEIGALADDLLINVTSFFRDPEVFDALEKNVIGRMFDGRDSHDTVRVWSVGCASGEEAYSLAILLLEEAGRRESPPVIQVFASDLHKQSLDRAREGYYPGDISKDVRADRLERFFLREDSGYRIKREVRECVVFAQHNVLSDPPFSRIDLITCRNLFIYLDRQLHQQVTEIFHYALNPDGVLVLGTSESIDESELFRVEDKKRCIFRRSNVAPTEPRLPVFNMGRMRSSDRGPSVPHTIETMAYGGIHQRIMEQYTPPSVLLSPDNHVLHFSAHAGRFFRHPGGAPTTSVFKLVYDDFRIELKTAVSTVRAQHKPVRTRPIEVLFDGEMRRICLDVRPAREPEQEGFLLVLFEELPVSEAPSPSQPDEQDGKSEQERTKIQDVVRAKEIAEQRLQEIIKEYETGQEDLRASNEELQSANEELRSTFEELETSKEELQSINEELQTVNQENRHKVEELALLSGDLQNLFAATDIATIFLDREFRILRFTPRSTDLFNIQMSDRGRPLSDFTHRLGQTEFERDARLVLERLIPVEREIEDTTGRWYLMRIRPYRSSGDRIAGVVLTFVDMTQRRTMEEALRTQKEFSEHIIETLPQPLLVLSENLVVKRANAAYYAHFGVAAEDTKGRRLFELGNGQWDIPSLRDLLEKVLPDNNVFNGYQVDHVFERLGRRVMLLNARKLGKLRLILLGINDITERYEVEKALRMKEERLQRMINVEGVGVLTFDHAGTLIDANDAFLRMVGYSREDVLQGMLTWRIMTPPEHLAVTEQQLAKLRATGRLGPYEKEYIHKDGSKSWMVFAGADLGDGTIVEYCIDVSARKQAEAALREAEKRLKADLEAMSTLHRLGSLFIAEGNLPAILHEIIDAAMAITGADFGNISIIDTTTGRLKLLAQRGFEPWWVEFWNRTPQEESACSKALAQGGRLIVEDIEGNPEFFGTSARELQRRAGVRAIQATPLVSRSGRALGVFATHSKTPGKPGERTLQLLDLLARQASDIIDRSQAEEARQAHLQLVEVDRRKNEFLAMLSHELRNPLTPIQTSLYILDRAPPGSDRAIRAREVIGRQVGHMTHLIEDLLDVTRITSGKVQLQREMVELNDLAQRAVADHREVFSDQGVDLELLPAPDEVWVHADRTRILQVIGNLLQNSVKFTSRGGKTTVTIASEMAQQQAIVRIKDTGRGIAPEVMPRLFEAFMQADATLDRSKGGLGLGLAVVKGLVEMHGGRVRGTSEGLGKGAEFTIMLPLKSKPAPKPTSPEIEKEPSKRILVIEDNKDAADTLQEVLALKGHEVAVAYSGRDGVDKARAFEPEFIFCDIGLPVMNGFEVATALRADPKFANVTLVALTGYAAPDDVAKTKEAGFDMHLAKPPTIDAIVKALSRSRQ